MGRAGSCSRASPAKLQAAAKAIAEIKQLKDAIFSTNIDSAVKPPPIAREYMNASWIISANLDGQVVNGGFSVAKLLAGTVTTVLFEDRTVTATLASSSAAASNSRRSSGVSLPAKLGEGMRPTLDAARIARYRFRYISGDRQPSI